ncbi:MAG TPA: ATP-binding protein [Edaphobacter sp.]|nr:ATP-binding protein [Edaphobacter sp.]
MAFRAYETNGCTGFADHSARHEPAGSTLLNERGQIVCRTSNAPSLAGRMTHFRDRIDGRQVEGHYVWIVPVKSADGSRYEYVWFQPPSSSQRPLRHGALFHFAFPQLPVAIAVGGLATFVLVLLFTRPLVRLRKAARQLAEGNLSARVEEARARDLRKHSDEFQGLIHDFNHMAERLESLVGAQRLLLRDVSHELRSPLSRLSVALDLAHEDAPPELGEHLARIERETKKLNQLIGQLLTLSSMEIRESTSTFKPVSLNELCEQILPDAEYEAQQRPCTVVIEQEHECIIQGDWELLYRAIENVVRNAIRYTEAGTQVTLRIKERLMDAQRVASIEVTDCGPGIPVADLEHIFRPFYRLDVSRNPATGGFGVGLAITERAIRLHGGTIRAINRPSGGISIEMTFPADHPA